MADRDEDFGLGLRLPWGRVSPPAEEAHAGLQLPGGRVSPPADEADEDAVAAPTAPPTVPSTVPAGVPEPPLDPIVLRRGFEALIETIEGRFDRLDQRMANLEHGLPERLDVVGARLAEAASAGAGPPDRAVIERLERGFDRGVRLLEGRLGRLEDRVASSNAATVEALGQVGGGLAEESGADAVGAVLDRRLDRLETLVATFHESTMGALARSAEQVDNAQAASHAAVIDRLAQLAPADLVARLIQGVVTTGEMLDAELIDLKRLLSVTRSTEP